MTLYSDFSSLKKKIYPFGVSNQQHTQDLIWGGKCGTFFYRNQGMIGCIVDVAVSFSLCCLFCILSSKEFSAEKECRNNNSLSRTNLLGQLVLVLVSLIS